MSDDYATKHDKFKHSFCKFPTILAEYFYPLQLLLKGENYDYWRAKRN